MSVHMIYYKDGAKMMRPVLNRDEYLSLRNGGEQRQLVERIRKGEEGLKHKLVLRWEELEMAEVRRKMADVPCLPEPQKILALADEIIGDDLADRNLTRLRTHVSYSLKGQKKIKVYMTWTMDGLRFLNAKLGYPNF